MEARAGRVASCERERRTSERADEHPRDRRQADSGACAGCSRCSLRLVHRAICRADGESALSSVQHDERRVVLDARSGVERAHEVVDLLARGPRPARAETERLVERADPIDELSAQEDRERDRAVPQIVARQDRGIARPGRRRAALLVHGAAGEGVELRLALEALCDPLEEVAGKDAVVVGKRDELGVAGGRARRCERVRGLARSAASSRRRSVAARAAGRAGRRRSGRRRARGSPGELCRASDSSSRSSSATRSTVATTRSNRGSRGSPTRRTLTVRAARLRPTGDPRRRPLPRRGDQERAHADVDRSRAHRGRRRFDGRDRPSCWTSSTTAGSSFFETKSRRASRRRSTVGSTGRAGATSPGSTPTTSPRASDSSVRSCG